MINFPYYSDLPLVSRRTRFDDKARTVQNYDKRDQSGITIRDERDKERVLKKWILQFDNSSAKFRSLSKKLETFSSNVSKNLNRDFKINVVSQ